MDESRILSKIYDLLKDENVFNCHNETLIKFKYPAELLVKYHFCKSNNILIQLIKRVINLKF